jgi:hypothetical protein
VTSLKFTNNINKELTLMGKNKKENKVSPKTKSNNKQELNVPVNYGNAEFNIETDPRKPHGLSKDIN